MLLLYVKSRQIYRSWISQFMSFQKIDMCMYIWNTGTIKIETPSFCKNNKYSILKTTDIIVEILTLGSQLCHIAEGSRSTWILVGKFCSYWAIVARWTIDGYDDARDIVQLVRITVLARWAHLACRLPNVVLVVTCPKEVQAW